MSKGNLIGVGLLLTALNMFVFGIYNQVDNMVGTFEAFVVGQLLLMTAMISWQSPGEDGDG